MAEQLTLIPFEKEIFAEINLYDKKEKIRYSANPSDYYNIPDTFIFENTYLIGIEQNKKGRNIEKIIKLNPSKKDFVEYYLGRRIS